MCSLGLIERASRIFTVRNVSIDENDKTTSGELELEESQNMKKIDDDMEEMEDWENEGLSALQKTLLGFIWMSSLVYAMISNVILTKKRDVKCSVRSDLRSKFNVVSLFVVIAVPVVCICLWVIAHILLTFCSCVKRVFITNRRRQSSVGKNKQLLKRKKKSSNGCIEVMIVFCFVIIFLAVYPASMYITEMYFANVKTIFPYMLIKYCVGSLQLVISPLCILLIKRDIRKGVKVSYTKGSTQNDEAELTYEELQEHLGIGVQVSN